jgi:hypothetical protein
MQASEYFSVYRNARRRLQERQIQTAERAGETLRGYAKLRPLAAHHLDSRRLL